MRKGLVLGKFLPLHNGHLALINYASKQCDQLIVWLCAADHESIDGKIRFDWLEDTFKNQPNIVPQLFSYKESEAVSSSSVADWDISKAWAKIIQQEIGSFDVFISSEPYGEYLSALLGVEHILFDKERNEIPISGTEIRTNPYNFWDFLPDATRRYYFRTVCIIGTESTGKTELTKRLAAYFNSDYVSEVGRDLVEDSNDFQFEILPQIAHQHALAIVENKQKFNKILFVDTDINITRSYSKFIFNRSLEIESWIEKANEADLYLYLDADAPFIQDGTRLNEESRNLLDASHKTTFKELGIHYHMIQGNWEERFLKALKIIRKAFQYE